MQFDRRKNYYELMEKAIFRVKVPIKATYDPEDSDILTPDVYVTNEGKVATDHTMDGERVVCINILRMLKIFQNGFKIKLTVASDAALIYEFIVGHLIRVREYMSNNLLRKEIPMNELENMENFADEIYTNTAGILLDAETKARPTIGLVSKLNVEQEDSVHKLPNKRERIIKSASELTRPTITIHQLFGGENNG